MPRSSSGVRASPFLVGRQLGRRNSLETFIGNRLSARDREAVRSAREALLGPLHGRQLVAEIVFQAFVELVLVEIGREIRRVVLVGGLAVVHVFEPAERPLDPLPFGRQ